ncbi:hypothetical protein EWB00_005037 [Schistosoma japonicum]|uniref:Uncharacterized protein n=1 Tax=Schistosoma japonicum TaxID=6182 RepID=A0A4Z2D335_SCHJA|nr:hypothetical protein EWB00_005037 [Schistosoma japonicum]
MRICSVYTLMWFLERLQSDSNNCGNRSLTELIQYDLGLNVNLANSINPCIIVDGTIVSNEGKSDEVKTERGMKPVIRILGQSIMNGMHKIWKTIDTYSQKDDLDKKLYEVAKIVSRRIEKRHEYIARKLEYLFLFSTC